MTRWRLSSGKAIRWGGNGGIGSGRNSGVTASDCFSEFNSQAKVIVYTWVNDRNTLRKAGAGTDPYAVFARMLAGGNPPDDWPALLAMAQSPEAERRFDTAGSEEGSSEPGAPVPGKPK